MATGVRRAVLVALVWAVAVAMPTTAPVATASTRLSMPVRRAVATASRCLASRVSTVPRCGREMTAVVALRTSPSSTGTAAESTHRYATQSAAKCSCLPRIRTILAALSPAVVRHCLNLPHGRAPSSRRKGVNHTTVDVTAASNPSLTLRVETTRSVTVTVGMIRRPCHSRDHS